LHLFILFVKDYFSLHLLRYQDVCQVVAVWGVDFIVMNLQVFTRFKEMQELKGGVSKNINITEV